MKNVKKTEGKHLHIDLEYKCINVFHVVEMSLMVES